MQQIFQQFIRERQYLSDVKSQMVLGACARLNRPHLNDDRAAS